MVFPLLQETFECLMKGLRGVAEKHGERVLNTATNTISIGMLRGLVLQTNLSV